MPGCLLPAGAWYVEQGRMLFFLYLFLQLFFVIVFSIFFFVYNVEQLQMALECGRHGIFLRHVSAQHVFLISYMDKLGITEGPDRPACRLTELQCADAGC